MSYEHCAVFESKQQVGPWSQRFFLIFLLSCFNRFAALSRLSRSSLTRRKIKRRVKSSKKRWDQGNPIKHTVKMSARVTSVKIWKIYVSDDVMVWFCNLMAEAGNYQSTSKEICSCFFWRSAVQFRNPRKKIRFIRLLTWQHEPTFLNFISHQSRDCYVQPYMNVYFYTAHITWCLVAVYNAIEWDRTSACESASGCRYQFIFDLTHPPNPCMKCEIDHHTGNIVPYSFRQVRGFFNVPC